MIDAAIIAGIVLVGFITIGLVFTKLYKKSTKERAFIRTGLGGEKVIMNGGAVVLPVLHEIMRVNMNTLRLAIEKKKEQALITKDRLRVDVLAEFYVRVKLDKESISMAAQTLGAKTLNPDELKGLIEGKFVDALRSVAAEMDMEELHEKRVDFVQKVQNAVAEDLLKNGLELESVSLTGLDQTDKEFFNPENAFDAEGLKKLAGSIEKRKQEKNEIEKNTALAIQTKDLETEKKSLELSKEEEYAKLDKAREIAIKTASQESEIAKEQSEKRQEAESARIDADEEIEKKEIQKEQNLSEQRIIKEKSIQEKEIEKSKALESAKIDKEKVINIAEQDKAIEISNKEKEEFVAKTEANEAKALEVASKEKVVTAGQTEVANRDKELSLINANKIAQEKAIEIKVSATSKKEAAENIADALRLEAKGKADAIITEAEANEKKYEVEAEGQTKLNEARNKLSTEQVELEFKKEMVSKLPGIIAEAVKPMANIDSIKIVDMNGVNQSNGGTVVNSGDVSLPDQVVNASLRHRTSLPILNNLMDEVGFDMNSVASMVGNMKFSKEAPENTEA